MKYCFLLLLAIALFGPSNLAAQSWDWNGRTPDSQVQQKIKGLVRKMASDFDCSSYAYGKTRYHEYDVYSYRKTSDRIYFEVRFKWQIDYDFWPSKQFSFTISASMDRDGCNSEFTFNDETGGNGCSCRVGKSYRAGCVY